MSSDDRNVITINLDAKCAECGRGGRCGNGLCMGCTARAMNAKSKMKTAEGKAVQALWKGIAQDVKGKNR